MPFNKNTLCSYQRGVSFISKDRYDANGEPQTVTLLRPTDGLAVKVPCIFGSPRMDSDHGRLVFTRDGKVLLYDIGSKFGTFVYSKNGETALEKDKPYELRERESIIFGAREYKRKGTPAARVSVKILPYHVPQIHVVAAQKKGDKAPAPMNSNRKPEPSKQTKAFNQPMAKGASKLPVLQYRHQARKLDGCLANGTSRTKVPFSTEHLDPVTKLSSSFPKARPSFNNKDPSHPSAHQWLDTIVLVPSTRLTLGEGIDALTGLTLASGLDPESLKYKDAMPLPENVQHEYEMLQCNNLNSTQSKLVTGIGATVNVPPVDLRCGVKFILDTGTSNSQEVGYLKYTVEGIIPMQRLKNPVLRSRLEHITRDEFRARYGDYFVNGVERHFGYEIVVAFSANKGSEAKTVEVEAKAKAASIFDAIGEVSNAKRETSSVKFLKAYLRIYGYSEGDIDPNWESIDAATKNLAKKGRPIGVPRLFELRHYSLLENCKLTRTLNTSHHAFEEIGKMRNIYQQLENRLSHPAITPQVKSCIMSAMEYFSSNHRFLALNDLSSQAKRHTALKGLKAAAQAADRRIERFGLLQSTKYMDKKPKQVGDPSGRFKWECGHLGKATRPEKQYGKVVEICGVEAFEVDWETPEIKHTILDRSRTIKFWSENNCSKVPDFTMASVPYTTPRVDAHETSCISPGDVSGLHRRLAGAKFTVLGWSISCEGKGKPEPRIKPNLPNNCILQDMFEVSINTTVTTRWHCRVTFLLHEPGDK